MTTLWRPALLAPDDESAVPFVPWPEFLPWLVARIAQGEHLSAIGQTRSGKSTLLLELAEARTAASDHWHSLILANKPEDATLHGLTRRGWHRVSAWDRIPRDERRALLWPRDIKDPNVFDLHHAQRFDHAIRQAWVTKRRMLLADEIRYLAQTLGLRKLLELVYMQGGSLGVGLWAGAQRAAWVPLEFYSQPRHLLTFRESSPHARKQLVAHVGGVDASQVGRVAARLQRHEFLYIDTWYGDMRRSRVEL